MIIALKIGRFTHADAGQMHLYLNYARERWVHEGENPPVGLILCAQKDEAVVKNYPYKSVKICLPNEISFTFISWGCPHKLNSTLKHLMSDYYQKEFKEYHKKTFNIDPSSFLLPLSEKLSPGAFILDIGCGSGRDLLWFRQRGFEVVGFERSPGLASLARKNAGCEVIEGDFETYDFSWLSVDAIMLVGALVHLPHSKVPEVLNSITKALKGNGKILLTLKKGTARSSDPHRRVFNLWQDDALQKLFNRLEKAG